MERRDFLRKTSLAAILAMSPFRLEASDFNILNEVSREELASLREVLEVDESEIQTDENTGAVHLNADRWPAIIYNFSLNPENIGIKGELTSTGSAFVLNDQGFFLTADHAYEEGKIMLVYDPIKGYALPARPLVHSTKDDIFLGKIDLPPHFSNPVYFLPMAWSRGITSLPNKRTLRRTTSCGIAPMRTIAMKVPKPPSSSYCALRS